MIGIYKIVNKNNGMVYIGQSDNCERRIQEHKKKRDVPIDMYINMLGVDNFDFEIIEECDKEELDRQKNFIFKSMIALKMVITIKEVSIKKYQFIKRKQKDGN